MHACTFRSFAMLALPVALAGPAASAKTVVLQDYALVQPNAVAVDSAVTEVFPIGAGFLPTNLGYKLGGVGNWASTMTVLATSSVERHSAVSTEWTVSGQSGAMTTSDGKLRMSGQSEWDLGSTGGTLSSSLAAGLWYRSSGGFLDLDGITGVQLSGSGASPLGAFFTLVLAQNFGFEEQKTAITEFVVNPGQSLSNVVLDFSQLQGFDETFTLATVTDMVIEVKFVVSAGAGNTSGSFNGAYDLSQVALVPSPAVLTVAAAAGLLRRRRKG